MRGSSAAFEFGREVGPALRNRRPDLVLKDGSSVGVVGGGPVGFFFSFFPLDMAQRVGIEARHRE